MCLLCARAFEDFMPTFNSARTEKERLLKEAYRLKMDILEAEQVVAAGVKEGTPCAISVTRLAELRARQYEISKKI